MNKQELFDHIKTEFELVIGEQMDSASKNIILCNLMTRLERNFNHIPIMSPMTLSEVKQYFTNHPEDLKIKQLYDHISSARV